MALSRKPAKSKKTEIVQDDKITELILKGGTSPEDQLVAKEEIKVEEEAVKFVQLRMPLSLMKQIDILVKERPGKLSRHTWIMEAIAEKLKKDNHN